MNKTTKTLLDFCNELILDELNKNDIAAYVGGGIIRDYFLLKDIDNCPDYDIWFIDEDSKNIAIDYFGSVSEKITTNKYGFIYYYKGKIFDVHTKYYGDPFYIFGTMIDTIGCAMTDGQQLYTHLTFYEDLCLRKINIFNPYFNNLDLLLLRISKLSKYGFHLDSFDAEIIKYKYKEVGAVGTYPQ